MCDKQKVIAEAKIEFYEDEYGEECDEISVIYDGDDDYTSLGKFISYGIHKRKFNSEEIIGLNEVEARNYIDSLTYPYLRPWLRRMRSV